MSKLNKVKEADEEVDDSKECETCGKKTIGVTTTGIIMCDDCFFAPKKDSSE